MTEHVVSPVGSAIAPTEPDTTTFTISPQEYLTHALVVLTGLSYAELPGANQGNTFTRVANRAAGTPDEDLLVYAQVAGRCFRPAIYTQSIKVQFAGSKALSLRLTAGADSGVRVLPWEAGKLTATTLDANATTFFTGPLQGCDVFVAQDAAGTVTVLHANANAYQDPEDNEGAKLAKADTLTALLGGGCALTHRLRRRDYQPADGSPYVGFVYGRSSRAGWRFFVHCVAVTPPSNAKPHIAHQELPAFVR